MTVWVEPGTTVLDAARAGGIALAAACGGRGTCGSCAVRAIAGNLDAADEVESEALRAAPGGVRLACRARVAGPAEVRLVSAVPRSAGSSVTRSGVGELVAGIDLGTTSVSAVLIELATGSEVGRATVENRQRSYGADVVSRLSAALDGALEELRALAEQSVVDALRASAEAAGVSIAGLRRIAIAGNTVMTALFAGVDASTLAVHPFRMPEIGRSTSPSAALRAELGESPIVILPAIASFVGGDLLADVIATGLPEGPEAHLLVDVGTNAEIALLGRGSLEVTSVPAGSAFEGAGLYCGGPAVAGAIDRVEIHADGNVVLHTIGGLAPLWFSGAGLVSAVAELVRVGAVRSDGALVAAGPTADRMVTLPGHVVGVDLGAPGRGLMVSQLDIRSLQLAKAALQVGIDRAVSEARANGSRVCELLIAGAFGGALDPHTLARLGFIPRSLAERSRQVGNAALRGAGAVALDPEILGQYESVIADARHIDLAVDAAFGKALIKATALERWDS